MLGQPLQLSFQGAAKWLFDVEIDKEHTRSNWLQATTAAGPAALRRHGRRAVAADAERTEAAPGSAGRWSWLQEDVARMQRNSERSV